MYIPVSTYRIQFNKEFNLSDAKQQAGYFKLLGVGALYAGPVWKTVPGSMHGYDVTDPHGINPLIGREETLEELCIQLRKAKIGWIQDIVPNHMAFSYYNPWIHDIMLKGPVSEYASFFDIDWTHPAFGGKLMIPLLDDDPETLVKSGRLTLDWHKGKYYFSCSGQLYPLNEPSVQWLISECDMPPDEIVNTASRDTAKLLYLLDKQYYKLCYWRESQTRINFRRFFTVNDLICLHMEDRKVFDIYHTFIDRLLEKSIVDGLRIDHVDGLFDPVQYLKRLRKLAGDKTYILVEKILGQGEELPDWPVQGTTGYDFIGLLNSLFVVAENMPLLRAFYHWFSGQDSGVEEIIYNSKKSILEEKMQGEWDNLCRLFWESNIVSSKTLDSLGWDMIKIAVGEFIMAAQVYRLYAPNIPLKDTDRRLAGKMITTAMVRNAGAAPALQMLGKLFWDTGTHETEKKGKIARFFMRCMQLATVLMAKGVEDTAMYRYNCFIAHNDVGGHLCTKGIAVRDFHLAMTVRAEKWPHTINTTSTHDTKRGEDVRTRLYVLSEIPEEWETLARQWMQMNRIYKSKAGKTEAPTPNEEYFIYQTLIGVFPFENKPDDVFLQRMDDYLTKALCEANVHCSWDRPNEDYLRSVTGFVRKILDPGHTFLESFLPFQRKIAICGVYNAISQLILKTTCPGVPDIYQGTELWDLTLVDPDNRQPVDYHKRHSALKALNIRFAKDPGKMMPYLMREYHNGYIKLWLTHRLLKHRKAFPDLFAKGNYLPLAVRGKYRKHILAFARHDHHTWHLTIIPLHTALLSGKGSFRMPHLVEWGDTRIELPGNAPLYWTDILTGKTFKTRNGLPAAGVFEGSCAGLLIS